MIFRNKGFAVLLLFCGGILLSNSCKMNYSFTGASISPLVKTVAIENFPNKAPLVVPTLSRTVTEALQTYFTSQTNLILVDHGGDLQLSGEIVGYSVQPQAIQGDETAALNRLTIVLSVTFSNRLDESQNWESTFSRYQDYLSSQNLTTVQDALINEITSQLVDDIFNKAVVNW